MRTHHFQAKKSLSYAISAFSMLEWVYISILQQLSISDINTGQREKEELLGHWDLP